MALLWHLEWGPHEESLLNRWNKTGIIPQSLENKPDIEDVDLQNILDGFLQLNRARSAGWSANPLSITDIVTWLDFNLIDEYEDRQRYYYIFSALDMAYIEFVNKKNKRKKGKDNADTNVSDRRSPIKKRRG